MIAIWISSRINHSSSSVVRFTSSCDPSTDGRFRSYTAGEASDLGSGRAAGKETKGGSEGPSWGCQCSDPLKTQEWEEWFRPHPNRVYAQYIRVAGSEGSAVLNHKVLPLVCANHAQTFVPTPAGQGQHRAKPEFTILA